MSDTWRMWLSVVVLGVAVSLARVLPDYNPKQTTGQRVGYLVRYSVCVVLTGLMLWEPLSSRPTVWLFFSGGPWLFGAAALSAIPGLPAMVQLGLKAIIKKMEERNGGSNNGL